MFHRKGYSDSDTTLDKVIQTMLPRAEPDVYNMDDDDPLAKHHTYDATPPKERRVLIRIPSSENGVVLTKEAALAKVAPKLKAAGVKYVIRCFISRVYWCFEGYVEK